MDHQEALDFWFGDDGFWYQETGESLGEIDSSVCDDLNQQLKADMIEANMGSKYVPGFGVKNRRGVIIYDSGIKRKKQRIYYVRTSDKFTSFVDCWFVLDDDEYWVQMGELIINETILLDDLNHGIHKGRGIKNKKGDVLTV